MLSVSYIAQPKCIIRLLRFQKLLQCLARANALGCCMDGMLWCVAFSLRVCRSWSAWEPLASKTVRVQWYLFTLCNEAVLWFGFELQGLLFVFGLVLVTCSTRRGALRCNWSVNTVCRRMTLLQQQVHRLRKPGNDLLNIIDQLTGTWVVFQQGVLIKMSFVTCPVSLSVSTACL